MIYYAEENDYDASDDFDYSVYEQYGMNIIPFMFDKHILKSKPLFRG